MSLDVYLRLRAVRERRAQPRATRRHVHLSTRPLVVAGYHLAGEPGAPVALRYGTSPDDEHLLVIGEPRDRTLRFARLAEFAADLARYLAGFAGRTTVERVTRTGVESEIVCTDAPQLVTPNPGTARWLTDTLGRSLRFLRPDGPYPVDARLPVAGAHLTFFAGRRVLPGSSAVLAATDLLTTHWVTGQLPVEDAELGTVLAWLDPPDGQDAISAALAAEAGPAAGPESDPAWDREVLQPLIGDYRRQRASGTPEPVAPGDRPDPVAFGPQGPVAPGDRPDPVAFGPQGPVAPGDPPDPVDPVAFAPLADECRQVLAPAWRHTWAALALVERLPEAAHVAGRWEQDLRAWTRHLDRVAQDRAYFRRRLDQLQSFRFLHELERRTTALARQMALDDPLLMAAQVVAGDALAGELVDRDCAHRITLPSGRAGLRPMLRLRPPVPFGRPVGTELWWADNPKVRVTVVGVEDDATVRLMVVAGACQSAARALEILPVPGTRMALVGSDDDRFPDNLPETLPWTHAPVEDQP